MIAARWVNKWPDAILIRSAIDTQRHVLPLMRICAVRGDASEGLGAHDLHVQSIGVRRFKCVGEVVDVRGFKCFDDEVHHARANQGAIGRESGDSR